MKNKVNSVRATLHEIHCKHRRMHQENPDSEQMCCMWSTDDPPDVIEGTEPIGDIENAFDIRITENEASDLYDMDLDQATRKIIEIRDRNK